MRTIGDTGIARVASRIGVAVFVSWNLVFGPAGVVLLLGVTYSMFVKNLALGIVCGALIFSPVVLVMVWAPVAVAALIAEKWSAVRAVEAKVPVQSD